MRIANYEESQRPIPARPCGPSEAKTAVSTRDFPGLGNFVSDRPARKVASVVLKRTQ